MIRNQVKYTDNPINSKYTTFMVYTIGLIRRERHVGHKDAFKMAAMKWKKFNQLYPDYDVEYILDHIHEYDDMILKSW